MDDASIASTASSMSPVSGTADDVHLAPPEVSDGATLWRLARDSRVLDVNSPYAYLLWCRDFAATSVVAYVDDEPVGFVTGYRRPDEPGTLMVWQVAVDSSQRGRGLGHRMLAELADRVGADVVETTISPDNEASMALFGAFARERAADVARSTLFEVDDFPGGAGHEPEVLFRIGPLGPR